MDKTIVSVWSNMLAGTTPEEALDEYVGLGYEGFELSRDHLEMLMERPNPSLSARELGKRAKEKNFLIPQAHLPMYDLVLSPKAEEYVGMQRGRIELLLELGVENIVIHLGKGIVPPPEDISSEYIHERRVWAINRLKDLVNNTNSRLCIENLVANCRTAQEIKDVLADVNCKNIAVCYDTGHQHQNHNIETASHFIETLGKNIKAVHINDNDGMHEQHLAPFALGLNLPEHGAERLDMDEVLFGLKSIGFCGLFNFELPGENACPHEVALMKLEYYKKLGNYLIDRMNSMEV